MNVYVRNVLISVAITLSIGFGLFLYSPTQLLLWQNLLIATFILGYTHFVIGFIYQTRSVFRKDNVRLKTAFILFFILSGAFALYLLHLNLITLLAILAVPYFMVHELFNEQTLTQQQTGKTYTWLLFVAGVTWFTALLFLAIPHNSFFYNNDLSYMSVANGFFVEYLQMFMPLWTFTTLPLFMLLVSVPALIYVVIRMNYWRIGIPVLLVVGASTIISLFFEPIAYVYLFSFILSYHFIMWMLHFGIRFYAHSRREFATYVGVHVVIMAPLILAVVLEGNASRWVYATFLNSATFVILTYIHITLSFLNETWVQRFFKIV